MGNEQEWGNVDTWDFPVLDDGTNDARLTMIDRRRKDRHASEQARLIVEWGVFAGAGLFCAGTVFGVAMAVIARHA